MPYREVKYRFDTSCQEGRENGANGYHDNELYDNGFMLSGLQAEEVLVGKIKTRKDIHGALESEQFCKIALEEAKAEEERSNHINDFVQQALVDFGRQVIDQAREKTWFFLKYGYLTPSQLKDIELGKMPPAYKIGQRGLTLNKCLQNTVRKIQIGFGAAKIRARLKGVLSHSSMKNDIKTLDEEMDILRNEQDEEKPNSPKCQLGENVLFDTNMYFGGKEALKKQGLEIRFYSSSQTLLDFAGGIDCWVELFDLKKKTDIEIFGIDITYNNAKHDEIGGGNGERKLADFVFFYSLKDIEPAVSETGDSFNWKVTQHFYRSKSYIALIKRIIERFKKHIDFKEEFQSSLDQDPSLEYTPETF